MNEGLMLLLYLTGSQTPTFGILEVDAPEVDKGKQIPPFPPERAVGFKENLVPGGSKLPGHGNQEIRLKKRFAAGEADTVKIFEGILP